jgi:DNA-binding NarL/FixJ family response regulator
MESPVERLSPREREILRLVAKGLANKEIAPTLEPPCKVETVKGHLKAIYAQLGVHNRAEAVAVWMRAGGE